MSREDSIRFEATYIGDELLKLSDASELERKCFTVFQVILDGDFSFEEALELYGVSFKDFEVFLSKHLIHFINRLFVKSSSPKIPKLLALQLVQEIFKDQISPIDEKSENVIHHFEDLSKQISEDKIRV